MKKILFLCFASFFICYHQANGQDTISTTYVKQHTHEFQTSSKGLAGEGGEFLKEEFSNAQFVLLGEYHGQARISQLTAAMIPDLAKVGFKYFCLETGPNSTKILNEMCETDDVASRLFNFYSDYYKQVKDVPIPFLDGVEDMEFLQAAINNKFKIFGIDQEYYSSTLLLIKELLSLDENKNSVQKYKVAEAFVIEQHLKDEEEKNYPLMSHFIESAELKDFFNSLDTTNAEINQIIKDIKLTWLIYKLHSSNLNQNLEMRADYMKQHFSNKYKLFSEQEPLPKILIKMGSYHTMRGITYNAVYDIGSLVNSLSDFNGTNDLNIGFLNRFYEDDEEPEGYFDNSVGDSDWLKQHRPLILQGQKENWVVIDLKSMKEDIINRKIWAYPSIRNMIYDKDLIIIPPMERDVSLNYKVE